MAFLKLDGTKILDCVEDTGDVEIDFETQMIIAKSQYGHIEFDYIGGKLVHNGTNEKLEALEAKERAKEKLIQAEIRRQAITAIQTELDAIDTGGK